jgi:sigma-B regulation protein RsbU (phosphoserine phosphatase)
MRIQTKLFLLLLVIAILPLAALSWRSERATTNLGLAIAEHGKSAMIEEIESQLRQAVGYSSDLMAAQQRQVVLGLRLQAAAVERVLAGAAPDAGGGAQYMHNAFDDPKTWPPGTELALDHAIITKGREQAVPLSRTHQAFMVLPDANDARAQDAMRRLAALDPVYRQLNQTNPTLFYWQYVTLKDGVHSVFPGHGGYPAGYEPRVRAWFTDAAAASDIIWTQPLFDASTRRLLLTAALRLSGPGETLAGVTGIDIDILTLLDNVQTRLRLGGNAESYVVQLTDDQGQVQEPGAGAAAGHPTLRVLASNTARGGGAETTWDSVPETPVLSSGMPEGFGALVDDLAAGRDGIRQMVHKGKEAVWVYGRVEGLSSALLFIVPVDDIESTADQAQSSVREAIAEQVRLAGIASVALTLLVAVLSMVAARSVTEPLRDLAVAAQSLAKGDFTTRVDVEGKDEVAALGIAFNAMVPELRQHLQTKDSLALAREVQQKLLPENPPEVAGFDLAARSVYSEDVGGDYYDFLQLTDEAGERHVGVVVGDVAGHGIVAALTMTSVRVLLRSYAGDGTVLKPVIRAVNRHLADDATAGRFVTLVYLVIEPGTREVRWINAGHGPMLLYDPARDDFLELPAVDIPLGVNADWNFHEHMRDQWPSGGVLVIGTDGIWEMQNPEGRVFGRDGLRDVIRRNAHIPADDICAEVVSRLMEFADGEPQRDDVTLVVIKFP